MAAGEHSCTRRDVLGAAALAAVAVSLGAAAEGLPAPSQAAPGGPRPLPGTGEGKGKWARALASVRRAEGRMRAAEGACSVPGLAIEEVFAREETLGDRIVGFNRALARLLAAPAPDLAALAVKIGLAADYEAVTLNGCEQCLQVMKADALRLAELAPAPR